MLSQVISTTSLVICIKNIVFCIEQLIKNETCDLLTYDYSILTGWKNYFIPLLNVHWVNVVRWTDRHTSEPLVPEPSVSEVEMAIEKLK